MHTALPARPNTTDLPTFKPYPGGYFPLAREKILPSNLKIQITMFRTSILNYTYFSTPYLIKFNIYQKAANSNLTMAHFTRCQYQMSASPTAVNSCLPESNPLGSDAHDLFLSGILLPVKSDLITHSASLHIIRFFAPILNEGVASSKANLPMFRDVITQSHSKLSHHSSEVVSRCGLRDPSKYLKCVSWNLVNIRTRGFKSTHTRRDIER